MTTTPRDTVLIEVERSVVDAVAAAAAEREIGISLAESADTSGWDRALIDQAIAAFAATGREFSANDLRNVLPGDVRGSLMGPRFRAALNAGSIRFTGWTTSTLPNTHHKPVGVYLGEGGA